MTAEDDAHMAEQIADMGSPEQAMREAEAAIAKLKTCSIRELHPLWKRLVSLDTVLNTLCFKAE